MYVTTEFSAATLCMFKSLVQVKKPTPKPELVRTECDISLSKCMQ